MADHGLTGETPFYQRVINNLIHAQPWPRGAVSIPRMQAHRGYWLEGAQENTLEAFRAAKTKGAKMIELDTMLSSDHIPVVFHDEEISRFAGEKIRVRELTAQELKERVKAPTLEEVLSDPQVPRKVNIELKTDRLLDEPLERKVLEVVNKTQAGGRVLFSSFNPFSLWRMSLFTTNIPLALLVAEDLQRQALREMWFAPILRLHALHLSQGLATDEALRYWGEQGVPISVWTVNEKATVEKYLHHGCLSVISDQVFSDLV